MFGKKELSDKELLRTVDRKLARAGGARITANVQRGTVTLSGSIPYENLRTPLVKAVRNIAGVRNVIDQLAGPSKGARPAH